MPLRDRIRQYMGFDADIKAARETIKREFEAELLKSHTETALVRADLSFQLTQAQIEANNRLATFATEAKSLLGKARVEGRTEVVSALQRSMEVYQSPEMPGQNMHVGPKRDIYTFDFPWRYSNNMIGPRRRPDSILDLAQCRAIANTYDVIRIAIAELKREVAAMPISIQFKHTDEADGDEAKKLIDEAMLFFEEDGGYGGIGQSPQRFEDAIFDDILICGSYAAFHDMTLGGTLIETVPISVDTIKPVVDAYGWNPNGPTYEQWVQGFVVGEYSYEELTVDGVEARTSSPYYCSPIELLLSPIITGMKSDEWNRMWLTDGDTPSDLLALPGTWTPEQIEAYAAWFHAIGKGNTGERRRTRFVPEGTQKVTKENRRDADFAGLELWVARRVFAYYGVKVDNAGLVEPVARNVAARREPAFGAIPLFRLKIALWNRILKKLGYSQLHAVAPDAQEEPGALGQRLMVAAGGPWITVNEARKEENRPPLKGKEFDTVRQNGQDANASGNIKGDGSSAKRSATNKQMRAALSKWQKKAIGALARSSSADCEFVDDSLSEPLVRQIRAELGEASDEDDVIILFARYIVHEAQET